MNLDSECADGCRGGRTVVSNTRENLVVLKFSTRSRNTSVSDTGLTRAYTDDFVRIANVRGRIHGATLVLAAVLHAVM